MIRKSRCPIYGMEVHFCNDPTETLRLVNKLRTEAGRPPKAANYYAPLAGACSNAGDDLVFSVFDHDISTVAHEAVHAASKTLRECGIKIGSEDDHENLTYLVEWYFNEWIRRMGWKVTVKVPK